MSKKRLLLSACPLYLLFYIGDAFLCSYYSLYFIERNVDDHQRAILLAVIPFAMFVGCTVFSSLAKNSARSLWLYRFCLLAEAGLVLLYILCDSFYPLLVVTAIIGFVNGAPFSLIEGYLVPRIEHRGGNYAWIRIFGSIGYAVSLLAGFFMLQYIKIHQCFYFASGFFLSALALSFLFHEKDAKPSDPIDGGYKGEPVPHKHFKLSHAAIIYCLSQMLIYGSFNGCAYIFPVHLNSLGFPDANYSLMRGIGVVIEIAFFLLIPLAHRLFRNKKVPIILAGSFFAVSTISGVFFLEPWSLSWAFFTLNSIAKALLFSYQATLLNEVVGEDELIRVLTVSTGGINLCSAALNLFSAKIFEAWGYQGYFGLITFMEAIGVALVFFLPRKQQDESEPVSAPKTEQ